MTLGKLPGYCDVCCVYYPSIPSKPNALHICPGHRLIPNPTSAPWLAEYRSKTFTRNKPDAAGGISNGRVAQLKLCTALTPRDNITIGLTHTLKASFMKNMYKVGLNHVVTFSQKHGTDIRLLRFVRAAKIKPPIQDNAKAGQMEAKHTVEGYVTFSQHVVKDGLTTYSKCHVALTEAFAKAKWSYDGPRKEFQTTEPLTNTDDPGDNAVTMPYGIATEFLSVLFNQSTHKILAVAHYEHCLLAFAPDNVRTGKALGDIK